MIYLSTCIVIPLLHFSPVQSGIYRLEKVNRSSTLSLSNVCQALPMKKFQCFSDWRWPFLILSRKTAEGFILPSLSPPGDSCCDVLGIVSMCAHSAASSSKHKIFQDASYLWWPLCPSVYPLSFPWLHVQGSTSTEVFKAGMSSIHTCQSGLSIPLFVASSVNLWR